MRIWISDKFPGDADAVSLGPHFENSELTFAAVLGKWVFLILEMRGNSGKRIPFWIS